MASSMVQDWRVVGERHLKLVLHREGRREPLNAIQFGGWHGEEPASTLTPGLSPGA